MNRRDVNRRETWIDRIAKFSSGLSRPPDRTKGRVSLAFRPTCNGTDTDCCLRSSFVPSACPRVHRQNQRPERAGHVSYDGSRESKKNDIKGTDLEVDHWHQKPANPTGMSKPDDLSRHQQSWTKPENQAGQPNQNQPQRQKADQPNLQTSTKPN